MDSNEVARILDGLFSNVTFGNVTGTLTVKSGVIESMIVSVIKETRYKGTTFRAKGDYLLTRYPKPTVKTPQKPTIGTKINVKLHSPEQNPVKKA